MNKLEKKKTDFIRKKNYLSTFLRSFCQYYTDNGVFGVCVSTSANKITELLTVLSEEIEKITHNISQDEIDRSLAQVKASLYMSRETADNWVSILAGNYSCYDMYSGG